MRLRTISIVALLSVLKAPAAVAGAWTQPQGSGQVIVTAVTSRADEGFGPDGLLSGEPPFRGEHADALFEYGWSDALTLRAKGAVGRWSVENGGSGQGFGVQELGARLRLVDRPGLVGSLEASLRVAEAHSGGWSTGYDIRALAGTSFELWGRPAFADAQVGIRGGDGDLREEVAADVTLGLRVLPATLVLLQSFSSLEINLASDALGPVDRHRVQASVVYDFNERWAVQAGAQATVAGAGVSADQGLLAALWYRF